MKKIYFANTTWNESPQLIENFIHQTPENLGVWGNITYTLNKDESDYIIVMDETTESVDPKKVIFFGREPHYIGLRKWTQESSPPALRQRHLNAACWRSRRNVCDLPLPFGITIFLLCAQHPAGTVFATLGRGI